MATKKFYQFKLAFGRGLELQAPLRCGLWQFAADTVYETPERADITRITGAKSGGVFEWVGTVWRDEDGKLCEEPTEPIVPVSEKKEDEVEPPKPVARAPFVRK